MPAGTLKVSHSGARHSSYNCKHVGYRCKHVRQAPVFTSVTAMQAPVFTSVTVSVYICKPSVYICKQRDGGVAVAIAPAKYCGGKSGSDTPFCAAAVAVTAR